MEKKYYPVEDVGSRSSYEDVEGSEVTNDPLLPSSHKPYQKRRRITWSGVLIFALVLLNGILVSILGYVVHTQNPNSQIIPNSKLISTIGLNMLRTKTLLASVPTKFMAENNTEADEAWDKMHTGHGVVAFEPEYIAQKNLPDSVLHPDGSGRMVYVFEAYHQMHCIKVIREHYFALARGHAFDWDEEHDKHCFDTLRQYVMCNADDQLLSSTGHRDGGWNQTRQCRDWDALRDFSTKYSSCYSDHAPPPGETRWGICDGGDDGLPIDSLLGETRY